MLFINKFLQSLTLHNEITPRDNGLIFIHGEQLRINYGTTYFPFFGMRETIICIPKVQGDWGRVPVLRAQLCLAQASSSMSSQVIKCSEFVESKL